MTDWSQAETIALATRAARGAGLPYAQAAVYAAASARHLAQSGDAAPLIAALQDAGRITAQLTRLIALPAGAFTLPNDPLTRAALQALPGRISCKEGTPLTGHYAPELRPDTAPPTRIKMPDALLGAWQRYAQKTYVPESDTSRAGAGAAETD